MAGEASQENNDQGTGIPETMGRGGLLSCRSHTLAHLLTSLINFFELTSIGSRQSIRILGPRSHRPLSYELDHRRRRRKTFFVYSSFQSPEPEPIIRSASAYATSLMSPLFSAPASILRAMLIVGTTILQHHADDDLGPNSAYRGP